MIISSPLHAFQENIQIGVILIMLVLLCYVLLHFHGLLCIKCHAQKVPNLYVFGDSIVENGYKTLHEAGLKMRYRPYGIECYWLGPYRFTNGKTIPEIIASSFDLGLPVSFDEIARLPKNGVNYASASAGILPETGITYGKNYFMGKQISLFRETVENNLQPKFQSIDELSEYLSNSLYIINIGSSDYIHNYLQPENYDSSRKYNGREFAELLTTKLGNYLQDLYNLGARKMVIFQIGPLGCLPYVIKRVKPRSRCAEDVNRLVSIFNEKLNAKIKELSTKLHGSTLIIARTFNLIRSMIQNPTDYGFKDTRWPCCPTQKNGTGLCEEEKFRIRPRGTRELVDREANCFDLFMPDYYKPSHSGIGKPRETTCEDRKIYLFMDELHLTEAANKVIVNKCLASSNSICSPSSILPYLVKLNN